MGIRKAAHWWSGWGFGREATPSGPDFADLGTAFGLDASLDGDTAAQAGRALRPWAETDPSPAGAEPQPVVR